MVEARVREGQSLRRRLDQLDVRAESLSSAREHLRALVDAGDHEPAPEKLGRDEARSGRDVEDVAPSAGSRETRKRRQRGS